MDNIESFSGGASPLLDNIRKISGHFDNGLGLNENEKLYNVQELETPKVWINWELFNQKRRLRYDLQNVAQNILTNDKFYVFQKCCRINFSDFIQILHSQGSKSAYFGGLVTCHNVWYCPVCGSKIGAERCAEVLFCLESFLKSDIRNHETLMMVMTHSHTRQDTLSSLLEKRTKALSFFFGHRTVKKILGDLGNIGHINSFEITWSKINGFHPHNHILLFNQKRAKPIEDLNRTFNFTSTVHNDLIPLEDSLYPIWERACATVGLNTARNCFLIQGGNLTSKYVTKLHQEMTLSNLKLAKIVGENVKITHYSPMQILYNVQYLESQNKNSGVFKCAYYEFADSLKGKKQLYWSRGLKDYFHLKERTDQELTAPSEEDILELIYLCAKDFRSKLGNYKDQLKVLEIANTGNIEAIQQVLEIYGIRSFVHQKGGEKYIARNLGAKR